MIDNISLITNTTIVINYRVNIMETTQTLPSAKEIALAQISSEKLSAILAENNQTTTFDIISPNGEPHTFTVPPIALMLMTEVLTQLGQGNVVKITPVYSELTTQEAANILNISRPTFIKLLSSGVIPHIRIGNRRKIAFTDIMLYKDNLEVQRLQSLNNLSSLDQETQGVGY